MCCRRFDSITTLGCCAVALGCGEQEGGLDATGHAGFALTDEAPPLPEPEERRVKAPQLDAQQQQRKDEVERYVAKRYKNAGVRIVTTIQNYSGDVVDWVDPDSVPGSRVAPPKSPMPDGVEPPKPIPNLMEVDEFPELRGPADTIPYLRPTYARYVMGKSDAKSVEEFVARPEMGQPAGINRLYGGYGMTGTSVYYSIAHLPLWRSGIVDDNTFTLLEIAIGCQIPGGTGSGEMVGATAQRDRSNFPDDPSDGLTPEIVGPDHPYLRMQIETYHDSDGIPQGGPGNSASDYSEWAAAPYIKFVPYMSAPYAPGMAYSNTAISTVDGNQYDAQYIWKLDSGNWWFNHNGNWIGYYPKSNLTAFGANGQGCNTWWYGEVFDSTPSTWTGDDMASGKYANGGWQKAARLRGMSYCSNAAWTTCAAPTSATATAASPVDTTCYTTSAITNGGSAVGQQYYVGGPGRDVFINHCN